ncbi:restriction endonuclease subunit S [Xylanibacter rodentium]
MAMQKFPATDIERSLPVLKIKELGQRKCDDCSDRCSDSIDADYIIDNEDIIFSWSGTLMVDVWCGGKCGLNQHLFKVTPLKNYPRWFVYYWTNRHLKKFKLIAKDKAVTMGHIRRGDLENAEVAIPTNQNLEAMAKQLYDYWFVQFDFPNEEGKPYKSSGGNMVWNEKLKRNIPIGWNNGTLIDIANITMGQSPDGTSYNEIGEGVLFYQGSTDFGMRFPSVRQYTTAPSRFAKKGDILMSVRAPVGAVNIANNDCCIGRGLSALNSKIGSTTHLYYILNDLRIAFDQRNAAGTTFGSITKEDLYNLPIVIPAKEVISAFDKICSPMFDRQMLLGEEIDTLIKQRDELLPLLLNGQVLVNSDLSDD